MLLENCREVADFFCKLVEAVGDVSLQLQPDDSVTMMEGMVHPYKGDKRNTSLCMCVHRCMLLPTPQKFFGTSRSVTVALACFLARGAGGFSLMELESLDRQMNDGWTVCVFVLGVCASMCS